MYLHGARSAPLYIDNTNPQTAGNKKNCIAIRLKECLHGHQVKRPFSEKSFNLIFEGLLTLLGKLTFYHVSQTLANMPANIG